LNIANPINILMICYYYPPLADVGCNRSIAFAKYFKKYGWQPSIISVKNPDKAYCLLGNISPAKEISVTYTYSFVNLTTIFGKANGAITKALKLMGRRLHRNPFHDFFSIPDRFWGWIPLTLFKSVSFIQHCNVIYVSCTPFSSAIIGILLKLLTKKPLVIDFRDPFALNDLSFLELPQFRQKINKFIEKWILKHADRFIVTTEETRLKYIVEYPFIKEKIFCVYNGFDTVHLPAQKSRKFDKFTIIYTGNFYLNEHQDNELFFKALAKLKTNKNIDQDNFQFLFYGIDSEEILAIARKHSIEDIVKCEGRIPYEKVLEMISRSHLQLLRIVKLRISTKFFEGISLNIPFLATIPSGEVADLIRKYSPSSSIITDGSVENAVEQIKGCMLKYKNGQIQDNLSNEFLSIFSRENQTRKMMSIIRDYLDN